MPGDKTEKATQKKRDDERKKGNIFQSKDIVSAVSILAIFYTLKICLPYIYKYLYNMVEKYIDYIGTTTDLSQNFAMDVVKDCMFAIFLAAGPLLLMSIAVAIITTGSQTKFQFSHDSIKFKFSRLNPIEGIKRMFSLHAVMELLKSLLKVTIIIYALWGEVQNLAANFSTLLSIGLMQSASFIMDSVMNIVIKLSIVFIGIAGFDYLYQWWEYERKIRMSKQDIKEEYKQMEGDPQVKGKIKERQRKMSMQRMMQAVPDADVIVRNPTHFAVALKYDVEQNEAPIVVAKGQDLVALRIIKVAEGYHVPMKEDRPLARALYAAVEVNREIPPEFYNALAEVMAWVYTMKQKEANED